MNDIKIPGALSNYILANSFLLQLHIGQIHISSQLFITPRSFQIKGYFHLSILF